MQDSQNTGAKPASRRRFFVGAATVGAAAAAVTVLPGVAPTPTATTPTPKPAPEKGGGYSLSDHVKHYYRTTSA
jgi:hypothetical protein